MTGSAVPQITTLPVSAAELASAVTQTPGNAAALQKTVQTEPATKAHVQETLFTPQTAIAAASMAGSYVLAYGVIAAMQPENAVLALRFADTASANWEIVP